MLKIAGVRDPRFQAGGSGPGRNRRPAGQQFQPPGGPRHRPEPGHTIRVVQRRLHVLLVCDVIMQIFWDVIDNWNRDTVLGNILFNIQP